VGFTQKSFFPIAGLSADLIRRAVGLEGHGALVFACFDGCFGLLIKMLLGAEAFASRGFGNAG
jgi:hypothetical protein